MKRKFGRWEKTECDECGMEFQFSRAEPIETDGPVVCEACEMYKRGYEDGLKEAQDNTQNTPTEEANKAWNAGLDSTANPYPIDTTCWGEWAREFMRLNDEYMAKAVEQ
jgi:hypothetical protein